MELKQQNSVAAEDLRPQLECCPLVWFVHDSEAVDHNIGVRGDRGVPTLGQQRDPSTAVGTAELENGLTSQPTGLRHPTDCVIGLILQCLRFHSTWLVCTRVIFCELRQTAAAADV